MAPIWKRGLSAARDLLQAGPNRNRAVAGTVLALLLAQAYWAWPRPSEPRAAVPAASRSAQATGEKPAAEREVVAEFNAAEHSGRNPKALADLVVLISVDGLRPDVITDYAENTRRMQNEGTW